MNRRILIGYYIISIVFLLLMLGFSAYRIKSSLDSNSSRARETLAELKVAALSTYLAEGSFNSEYFKYTLRQKFHAAQRLRLLAIYSRSEGIQYLLAGNRRYLASPLEGPSATAGWKGEPEYSLEPLYELKLTSPFYAQSGATAQAPEGRKVTAPARQDLFLDVILRQLEWQDLYPLMRELLYMLLVFLLITVVMLLAVSAPQEGEAVQPHRSTAGGTPASMPRGEASEPAGLFSPETGLGWKEHLSQRLGHELERAASFDQDLSLMLIALDPRIPAATRSYNYRQLGKFLLQSFPFKDLAFEYDPRTCAVILPDKDLSTALKEARAFQKKLAQAPWTGGQGARVSVGLGARNGRLISATRLLLEAGKSLQRAEAAGAGHIMAFQADPEKFREVLVSTRKP